MSNKHRIFILISTCLTLSFSGCQDAPDEVAESKSVESDQLGSLLLLGDSATTPALPMAMVDSPVDVKISIVSQAGNVVFSDQTVEVDVDVQDGYIVVPPITLEGDADGADEAHLEFRHGDSLLGSVTIHMVANGDLQLAEKLLGDHDGAIVSSGQGFLFIDEQHIGEEITESPVVQPLSEDALRGICIETPFGAGQVRWEMASPKNYGYSIDDEDAPSSLRWASGGTEAVDAVYRTSWGCSKALKIPDSCTAYIGPNSTTCCCNGLFYLLGYQCKYINPSQDAYFTNCPL